MKTSKILNRKFLLGFLSLTALFSVLPPEFVIATLLFIAVTYGGVSVIKLATSHDLKVKQDNET